MLCQNCHKNEADRTFVASWMGMQYHMHLCDACLEQMWQYAGAAGQKETFENISGWRPGGAEARGLGEAVFTQQAGADLRQRRRMAALRVRLEEAAQLEDYEEAARLRDSIADMEEEAYSHES